MIIVVLEYSNYLRPNVVGSFNDLNEAEKFEEKLISMIQNSEYQYKDISPATYLHPIDGLYIADFNSDYHPKDHPIRIEAIEVADPYSFIVL